MVLGILINHRTEYLSLGLFSALYDIRMIRSPHPVLHPSVGAHTGFFTYRNAPNAKSGQPDLSESTTNVEFLVKKGKDEKIQQINVAPGLLTEFYFYSILYSLYTGYLSPCLLDHQAECTPYKIWSFFKHFVWPFLALLIVQLKSVTGNRVSGGVTRSKGPGVEPGSAAEPRHMGRTRYQLS